MIVHYLKIAWRNLRKYKTQTIISILGLTIGVVFFAYGYHWYKYETTYDSFYPDSDRIYHVYGKLKSTGKQVVEGKIPHIAVNKLEQAFPEIESVAVLLPNYGSSLKHGDRDLGYPLFEFVDERFFRMFPPQVIAGVVHENSLKNSDEMIVTESFACKHFGTPEEALGETLISGYDESYVIRAVIADPPANSIFQREGYMPVMPGANIFERADEKTQWKDFHDVRLYVKLNQNADMKSFRDKLLTFAVDNGYNDDLLFELIPLTLVRFSILDSYERIIVYDIKYIRMFIFAGVLLLFAAFFNYLNILLSNTIARVREINLRRVTGASVSNIYWQLFIEISLFIVIVALLSFCCIEITSRLFESIFATVVFSSVMNSILLCTISITAILLYLTTFIFLYRFIKRSAFNEDRPVKRRFVTGRITLSLQLIISVFAIMSAFVLWRQVFFMNHVNWGFDTENLLQITMKVRDRLPLMEEIEKLPMVESVINTGFFTVIPNTDKMGPTSVSGVEWENKPIDFSPLFQTFGVEEDFTEKMKLKIIKGRGIINEDFTRRWQADKVMINETAQRIMEMDNPIGQKIVVPANWYSVEGRGKEEYEIVGVVEDFHTVGLQSEIPPLIIKGEKHGNGGYFNYVRVMPGMEEEAVKAISTLIPEFRPDDENETLVQAMGQLLGDLSKSEKNLLRLFVTLALLCILIAVFGIYSVSQRETQHRQKEIAIRKTTGAKTKEIVAMFFREYMVITLGACVVALPMSWLFMQRWLETFAYRISISWWMFILVIVAVAVIVSVTIVSQVIRAASRNPAEVVKSE
ncbi:FtsX-like permease family protein [Porphyromonadaceae bacterium KH3CP3RA]|nr:FtsX-like permease family protein [Porphyromonadaceae bacterium KH3CP3RA]